MNNRWTMSDERPQIAQVVCAVCHAQVDPVAPRPDDDKGWRKVAKQHEKDCEWARTRCWTRDVEWDELLGRVVKTEKTS